MQTIRKKSAAVLCPPVGGSTNALTGVLNAWQDGVPLLILSGQHELNETTNYTNLPVRTYGQQQADIIELVKPITKYASIIMCKSEIRKELDKALFYAMEGRKGPAWIDIPLDLQSALVEPEELQGYQPAETRTPNLEIEEFCRNFKSSIEEAKTDGNNSSELKRPRQKIS